MSHMRAGRVVLGACVKRLDLMPKKQTAPQVQAQGPLTPALAEGEFDVSTLDCLHLIFLHGSATAKRAKSIVILDAQKGMLKACEEVMSDYVDPFLCSNHRVEHVRKSYYFSCSMSDIVRAGGGPN